MTGLAGDRKPWGIDWSRPSSSSSGSRGRSSSLLVCSHFLQLSASVVFQDRLVGLVVKASTSGAEIRGSIPACDGIFPGRVIPAT